MVAYRFDPDYTIAGRHYAHPLIQWPTIVAGAVAAIAIGFLLNMLGLAIGASAFNPYEINNQDETISIGGGLFVMFAQLVAFQVGAYIASRGARYPDHFGGLLTGFLVWAFAVAVAVTLATFAASGAVSGDSLPSGVAETIGELSDATDGQGANASDLATAGDTADAIAALSWWTVGALSLGLAGAVAGGWLGAHHPTWEGRPRLDDGVPYQTTPRV
ncbi:hypothetical protein [Terricaulis silvestris]|uniref:Uncharacterized protein n=1 Tax=Terricaulis silvestris TaxID=2686094 RepID=A0A6I6MLN4_9CAUL|nr:hypothetical protein [Terricaulis silvestris]QGZ94198.1 hypothetical protein DSM104635_01014 [Terricaulis silvestris]